MPYNIPRLFKDDTQRGGVHTINVNKTLASYVSVTLWRSQLKRMSLATITYCPLPLLNKFRFRLLEGDVVSHADWYWKRGSMS